MRTLHKSELRPWIALIRLFRFPLLTFLANRDIEARQKQQQVRDALIEEYLALTRQWMVSDDPLIEKKREIVVLKMRAQYHELVRILTADAPHLFC